MSFAFVLKALLPAVLFVLSGGWLFPEWRRRHILPVALAAILATLGTAYLLVDIYEDAGEWLTDTLTEEVPAEQHDGETRDEPIATGWEAETERLACKGILVDLASGGTKCIKPWAGEDFKDCAKCPEMVVVPDGSFMMGSPKGERGRRDAEGPQHEVTIPAPFAVGKFEVTRSQFEYFVRETGHDTHDSCRTWEDGFWEKELQVHRGKTRRYPGFTQSADHPVVCVSWNDAQAYVRWLSDKTGKTYRLLSEAE